MDWTKERVETLDKLWQEGRTASQIAAELGHGVTRNAVIGKVHRLGLSARARPAGAPAPRQRSATPRAHRPAVPMTHGNAALAFAPARAAQPAPRPRVEEVAEVVPMTEPVTIVELREMMCRWPLGDPTTSEFRYCGGKTPEVGPYCAHHRRVAYQPPQDRRRERDRERRAAVRA
ncbi:MAG: GcrA cell cycle regulator [Hyphomicrobiales bacterium]|nr:GcrA cell cycle regulator [Hyphomicrobiales bacterium]